MDGQLQQRGDLSAGPARTRSGEVTLALRQLQLASAQARQAMARRLGLGMNDVAALEHLLEGEEPMGPVELGHRLGIRSASATALVDRLEKAGHITRDRHPHDRRRQSVSPTQHARHEALSVLAPMLGALESTAADLTEEQAAAVIGYLTRAAQILNDFSITDQPSVAK